MFIELVVLGADIYLRDFVMPWYNMGHREDCIWTSSALLGDECTTFILVSFPIKGLVRNVLSFCYLVGAIGHVKFLSALHSVYSKFLFYGFFC